MKHKRNQPHRAPLAGVERLGCAMLAIIAWLGFAAPGFASLGGASVSIEADRVHLAAKASTVVKADYTVNVMTLPNGGTVKEFERSDGTVFAVAWRGPSRPDLRQLLGNRFEVLQSDIAAHTGRRLRSRLSEERSDFILHGAGHSGAFVGSAYLPNLAPAGFSASALH